MRKLPLYTVGHSNRPVGELLAILDDAGVKRLVDVRAMPKSRRWPQFDRAPLTRSLAAADIEYAWWGDILGGFRKPRPGSPNVALTGAFRGFADHMDRPEFAGAIDGLLDAAARTPTAIMCAEKLAAECHRSLITDYVLNRGVEVVHLVAPGACEGARMNPAARPVPGGLAYDRGAQPGLL